MRQVGGSKETGVGGRDAARRDGGRIGGWDGGGLDRRVGTRGRVRSAACGNDGKLVLGGGKSDFYGYLWVMIARALASPGQPALIGISGRAAWLIRPEKRPMMGCL